MTLEELKDLNTSIAIIGIKINALKLTLTEEQLKVYNNSIIEQLEKFEPILQGLYQENPSRISELVEACKN